MRCFRRNACTEVINFSSHFSDFVGSQANANLHAETVGWKGTFHLTRGFLIAMHVPLQIREEHKTLLKTTSFTTIWPN